MDRLFDAYVFVDWSASSSPCTGPNSIWAADCRYDGRELVLENPATRRTAEAWLVERLLRHGKAGRRVLLGFDFAFALPEAAAMRFFDSPRWTGLWAHLARHVKDEPGNENNRFTVAAALNESIGDHWFWSCPESHAGKWLQRTKRQSALDEYRLVERTLRDAGKRAFPVRQLLGAGAVGSQTLLGIPVCERLRSDERFGMRVWPFETGLRVPPRSAGGVIAEIWPRAIPLDRSLHPVEDAAQVLSYARWAAAQDAAATLGAWFAKSDLDAATRGTAESAEGWVLGA